MNTNADLKLNDSFTMEFADGEQIQVRKNGYKEETVMEDCSTWDDAEWLTFRDNLKGFLNDRVAEVTFIKKNGDERVMTCTLDPALLPEVPVVEAVQGVEPKKPRVLKNPNNTLAVYDTNAKGWRSFVVKNVTAVK